MGTIHRLCGIVCGVTLLWAMVGSAAEAPSRTGLVYSPVYLKHETAKGHPEAAERLEAIVGRLRESGVMEKLVMIEPRDAQMQWITTIHSPQYVERFRLACAGGESYFDSGDVSICRESYAVATKAAGGVLAGVDAVMEGRVRSAFCAVRPPGHHAMKDKAMGFCIFNNVAIAAKYIQKRHRQERVLIIDWDAHHGNGTQAAFYEDPSVFYFSVHRSPFYPGTGMAEERGSGKGEGFTLNVPMERGAGDAEYIAAFKEKLVPAARKFRPDFVLISAGFDAQEGDPLGGMTLTPRGYGELTRIAKGIAEESCGGRLVSVLEGGYNPSGLAESAEAHIRVLMEGKR